MRSTWFRLGAWGPPRGYKENGKIDYSMVLLVNPAMRTKKSLAVTALSLATALAIISPSAFAAAPTQINLGMAGIITNAGSQNYVIQSGYHEVAGIVNGVPLSSAQAKYSVEASVVGLTTSGFGSIELRAGSQSLQAQILIVDEIPASVFPLASNGDSCTIGCNSEVPLMFVGVAAITMSDGTAMTLPIAIESAYWNPFGGPIVISTLEDPANPFLTLIVTYNVATIDWSGVQLQGVVGGTYGSEGVSGVYGLVSNSHENLVAGNEHDSGQIGFAYMSDPALNAAGTYSGNTKFNLAGSMDCSGVTGLPEGTCTSTGATSSGVFNMLGATGLKITGSFTTIWSVPSITATTSVSARAIQ